MEKVELQLEAEAKRKLKEKSEMGSPYDGEMVKGLDPFYDFMIESSKHVSKIENNKLKEIKDVEE